MSISFRVFTVNLLLCLLYIMNTSMIFGQNESGVQVIDTLKTNVPLDRLITEGKTHQYLILMNKGEFLKVHVQQFDADLMAGIYKPDGTLFQRVDEVPLGIVYHEIAEITADTSGYYQIVIQSADSSVLECKYSIQVVEKLSAIQYQERLIEEKNKLTEVTAWIKSNARPLKSIRAGAGFDDLKPFKKILKDVRIVGLGEATHGTREYFQFKHRMLEFLVKEMGFTLFGMEESYSTCAKINDYVLHGKGNRGSLISSMTWVWNTEEVTEMIEWMRVYNQSVSDENKVKFLGFDNQGSLDEAVNYLKVVSPALANVADSLYKEFEKASRTDDKAVMTLLLNRFYELIGLFVINESKFIKLSSELDYREALMNLKMVTQMADAYRLPFYNPLNQDSTGPVVRDIYMFENFEYLLNREKPGSKMILWAHNSHISKGNEFGVSLGSKIADKYKDQYYPLGFALYEGTFQALEIKADGSIGGLTEFTLKPAPEKSIEWYLGRAGINNYMIDFRSPHKTTTIIEWLKTPLVMRQVGAVSSFDWGNTGASISIIDNFDGLVFIEKTSRARPNNK